MSPQRPLPVWVGVFALLNSSRRGGIYRLEPP